MKKPCPDMKKPAVSRLYRIIDNGLHRPETRFELQSFTKFGSTWSWTKRDRAYDELNDARTALDDVIADDKLTLNPTVVYEEIVNDEPLATMVRRPSQA